MANVGCRIYKKFDRPSKDLVEGFKGIPVANIGDQMGRISCVATEIKPQNGVGLLGTALTVKAPAGDNLMFHKALDMAEPGDIIVVDGEGDMGHALCGEIMMRYAMTKGITGFVVDGCIRDVEALQELDFGVFARGVNPKGPYKNGPGEINVPVSIGGQVVRPGDILIGDRDGLVVVRPEDAPELIEKSTEKLLQEKVKFEKIDAGILDKGWVDRKLDEIGCEFIDGFPKKRV